MAIVKKVAVKKLVAPKKDTIVLYKDNQDDKVYNKLEDLARGNVPEADHSYSVSIKDRKLEYEISELPYCCGVLELGELYVDKLIDIKEFTEYLDLLVAFKKGKTLLINTNGRENSATFEIALKKCKNWTAVKSFRNNVNGNLITMWVSNND
jgi:hypothetical protein